jgi:hypothetical protein
MRLKALVHEGDEVVRGRLVGVVPVSLRVGDNCVENKGIERGGGLHQSPG